MTDQKFLHGKRGISSILATTIVMAAVVSTGLALLAWTQYRTSLYEQELGKATDNDIDRLHERLVFEYIFYNGSNLNVYLMNCGTIDNVTVQMVDIYGSGNGTLVKAFSSPTLYNFDGSPIADQDLDKGEEGYLTPSLSLPPGGYSVRIQTGRGSIFEETFFA
jgi:hypothetical protein